MNESRLHNGIVWIVGWLALLLILMAIFALSIVIFLVFDFIGNIVIALMCFLVLEHRRPGREQHIFPTVRIDRLLSCLGAFLFFLSLVIMATTDDSSNRPIVSYFGSWKGSIADGIFFMMVRMFYALGGWTAYYFLLFLFAATGEALMSIAMWSLVSKEAGYHSGNSQFRRVMSTGSNSAGVTRHTQAP